jgi:hypothetical protein
LVAFINASIDFYQIQKSEAILASFLAMIPPACRVLRDGTIATIPAAELVKGDVVLLVLTCFVLMMEWLADDLTEWICREAVIRLRRISSCFRQQT